MTRPTNAFVSLVLLAGGGSARMGRPKQTLPWRGAPLLTHMTEQTGATCADEVIVVLGEDAATYRALLPDTLSRVPVLKVVENPGHETGKTTSVLAGLQMANERATDWMFLAMDSPRTAALLDALVAAHWAGGSPITYPYHGGVEGHPPVMAAALRDEILAITEDKRGLREVTERDPGRVNCVEFDDPLMIVNMNRPEDYERARALTGQVD